MTKRRTIGLLVNDIDINYSTSIWLMIKKAAEMNDCNVIALEGRSYKSVSLADTQHLISYSLIDKNRLDGIIIMSALIACYISNEEFIESCRWMDGIPMISIGIVMPFATSILVDNKTGMKNLINHLVKDHGYRRIAFISGPKTNTDSLERLEAYFEVLSENSIEIDERLIYDGDFIANSGYEIMNKIVKDGIEYDAIVSCNDEMALGAIKCMKDLRLDMKTKGIICGFDDSTNSALVKPSLTTVRQPIEEICYFAIETILKKIEGERVEDVITFPSVLVKRESCGCKNSSAVSCANESTVRLVPGQRIHENVQTYSLEELFDLISTSLKLCNINSCFVSRYCGGTIFFNENCALENKYTIPEYSELVYAFVNYERKIIEDDVKIFKTELIIPDAFIPKDRRFTYLVNPLFFKNEHFGFVCFEVVNDDVLNFEPIRGQISNTLKGALLLSERERMEERFRETERLASLGQLIGGLSHNLMTPIMSISGACFGLEDLIKEYRESIEDPSVTVQDHNDIADDMLRWVNKLKEYNSYMSNAISTVKSQAVQLNSDSINEFTIEELINRIKFVKHNNQKLRNCVLNISLDIDSRTLIPGDISNLVQIIDNLFVNSAESYEDVEDENRKVDFFICKEEDCLKLAVRDYGKGMSDDLKNKIFKFMITTKGKNGTGLSLLLSYSTIKGRFGGEIWFESKENQGTTFFIKIPIIKPLNNQ